MHHSEPFAHIFRKQQSCDMIIYLRKRFVFKIYLRKVRKYRVRHHFHWNSAAKAKKIDDLKRALELLNWIADGSLKTGVMPE